jgi:hypothetical protein
MAVERFVVEPGHVMQFARAVGDFAADHDASVPPTFLAASAHYDPDYPLRPQAGVSWWGSGREPGRLLEGTEGLHAEQHFTYHRPVRVGETLTVAGRDGETWTKEGRSGRLHFREWFTEFRGEAGELVVTMRGVGVRREERT